MLHFAEKIRPLPLLNVAACWKNSNIETYASKLSQMLENNIDHGGGGLISEFM